MGVLITIINFTEQNSWGEPGELVVCVEVVCDFLHERSVLVK